MGINEKLKKLRKIKGINQEQAAAEIGVSLSSYQKYERDKNSVTPSLDVLVKLADFYNVSTDYLLDRQDEKQKLTEEIKSQFNMTALETLIVNGYLSLPKDMRSDLMEFLQKSVKKVMDASESVQLNAHKQIKKTSAYNSELAIARSSNGDYMPAPTDEQYNSFEELTDDMLGE